jgi:hemolysin activation/secretion protein
VTPHTQGSLPHAFSGTTFVDNIDATKLTAFGVSTDLSRTFGEDPRYMRLFARVRAEGALTNRPDTVGTSGYGRFVLDATATHHIGSVDASLTGAGGVAVGDLPIQRAFFIGGLQTVRGEYARLAGTGRVGDSFWLGRLEMGPRSPGFRPVAFYDIGWAGGRGDFVHESPPLQSVGVGLSMLDGLLRMDAARGLWPERRWRFGAYLGSRF